MALLHDITGIDGTTHSYHRIAEVRVSAPGGVSSFVLESFTSRDARANPRNIGRRTQYDFVLAARANAIGQAYAALLAMPQWEGAQADANDDAPAPVAPAVLSGSQRWDGQAWQPLVPEKTLADEVASALDAVDFAAGRARLKYITSVPGQAETYQRKEQQARQWHAAAFEGPPPSFIAAEAEALGVHPLEVANEIIAMADFWSEIKGPQIEACRRKWKVAIEQASSAEQVAQLLEQGQAQMAGL